MIKQFTTPLLILLSSLGILRAAHYQVSTFVGGTAEGSLHWAISQAEANPGEDTITFSSNIIGIQLQTHLPVITESLIIDASNHPHRLTIDGQGSYRCLDVNNQSSGKTCNLTLKRLNIINGRAVAIGAIDAYSFSGGGLRFRGDALRLENCMFMKCTANNEGGGCYFEGNTDCEIFQSSFINCEGGNAGGLFLIPGSGSLTMENITFSGNKGDSNSLAASALHFAGGVGNTTGALIKHATFANNQAGGAGDLHANRTSVAVANSVFASGNSSPATTGVGGIVSFLGNNWISPVSPRLAPLEKFVSTDTKLLVHKLGPLSPLLDGADPAFQTTTDARGRVRDVNVFGPPDIGAFEARVVTLHNTNNPFDNDQIVSQFRDLLASSNADYYILNSSLTLDAPLAIFRSVTIVSGGLFGSGGATIIDLDSKDPVLFGEVLFQSDRSAIGGAQGGAAIIRNTTVEFHDCYFQYCLASDGGALSAGSLAKVYFNGCSFLSCQGGVISSLNSSLTLENCTLAANTKFTGSGQGGAIYFGTTTGSSAHLSVNHCTFYDNNASTAGGHIYADGSGVTATLSNSIFTAGQAAGSNNSLDATHSPFTNTTCYFGSSAEHVHEATLPGSAFQFHLPLLPGSDAIDNATPDLSLPTDQQGYPRPLGAFPDIGSVEHNGDPYLIWKRHHFDLNNTPLDQADDYGDLDGDGLLLVEEFAFNTHPFFPDGEFAPSFKILPDGIFSYGGVCYRENHSAPGSIGMRAQSSTDLEYWSSSGLSLLPFPPNVGGASLQTARSGNSIGGLFGTEREFFRVQVAAPLIYPKWSLIRDRGNLSDTNGYGEMPAPFEIMTYEVTNIEYTTFLNAVDPLGTNTLDLYHPNMRTSPNGGIDFNFVAAKGEYYYPIPGREDWPVVFVNYWDALRYTNWLHNGASLASDTELGAYTLLGGTPLPSNAESISGRNPGARVFLPSADEWYKAAYYTGSGYQDYPTGISVNNDPAPGDSQSANYNRSALLPVGSFPNASGNYRTYDMGGNVDEWLERENPVLGFVITAGGRVEGPDSLLHRSAFDSRLSSPDSDNPSTGFRVARTAR